MLGDRDRGNKSGVKRLDISTETKKNRRNNNFKGGGDGMFRKNGTVLNEIKSWKVAGNWNMNLTVQRRKMEDRWAEGVKDPSGRLKAVEAGSSGG